MTSYRLALFASGSGTNAERIMAHFRSHAQISVCLLLSNNPNAYALERARRASIQERVFSRKQLEAGDVEKWLDEFQITHIVLAGFLWLVPSGLLRRFPERIVNIHPALLPKYGGKGLYGTKVHEAVKASGDPVTGITIHIVNEKYDDGEILFQAECDVTPTDSPADMAEKVHALEHKYYPQVIEQWVLHPHTPVRL